MPAAGARRLLPLALAAIIGGATAQGDDTAQDADCAGAWSECTAACEAGGARAWVEATAQAGAGAACSAASPDCAAGDGGCSGAGPCGAAQTFEWVRFTPVAVRAEEGAVADACASRLILYGSMSGAAGGAIGEVLSQNATLFAASIQLPVESRVTSYAWKTGRAGGGGGLGCDPVRWQVEGSEDSLVWSLLDDRSVSPVCVGEARERLQGPFATACEDRTVDRARFVRVANEGDEARPLVISEIEVVQRQEAASQPRTEVSWGGVYTASGGAVNDTVIVYHSSPGVAQAYSQSGQWLGARVFEAVLDRLADGDAIGVFDSPTQTVQFVSRAEADGTSVPESEAVSWTRTRGLSQFNWISTGQLCAGSAEPVFRVSWNTTVVVDGPELCETKCADTKQVDFLAVPAASVESGPTYYAMDQGTCCCPEAHMIQTQADCETALDFLGLRRDSPWGGDTSGADGIPGRE